MNNQEITSPGRSASPLWPLVVALFAALVAFSAPTASSTVVAQEQPKQDKSVDNEGNGDPTAFKAADSDVVKENLPAWPFLYGAYFAIMLILMLYVSSLWYRQRRLDAEIDRLDKKLDRIDEALGKRGAEGGS